LPVRAVCDFQIQVTQQKNARFRQLRVHCADESLDLASGAVLLQLPSNAQRRLFSAGSESVRRESFRARFEQIRAFKGKSNADKRQIEKPPTLQNREV